MMPEPIIVLLTILMVAEPLVTAAVPVDQPNGAVAFAAENNGSAGFVVTMVADGRTYIGETEVPADELVARLHALGPDMRDERIYLKADPVVGYAAVMNVMNSLQSAGFMKIALITGDHPDVKRPLP